MPQVEYVIPLSYGLARRRRFLFTPLLIGVLHFAITYPLWWWVFNRVMQQIGSDVAAKFSTQAYSPAGPTFLLQAGHFAIFILMLPARELWWPETTPPWIFVAGNSVFWGLAYWVASVLVRTEERAA